MKSLIVFFGVIILSMMSVTYASAQSDDFSSFSTKSGLGFLIKQVVWDFHELITIDPQQKTELKIKHVQELQTEIETLVEENRPIPQEIENKRLQKLDEIEELIDSELPPSDCSLGCPDPQLQQANFDRLTPFEQLKIKLEQLESFNEVNEIRVLYGQFDNVQESNDENLKQQYNDMVNNLDSWDKHCNGSFDINSYSQSSKSDSSYLRLSEQCPILKQYDKQTVLSLLG